MGYKTSSIYYASVSTCARASGTKGKLENIKRNSSRNQNDSRGGFNGGRGGGKFEADEAKQASMFGLPHQSVNVNWA